MNVRELITILQTTNQEATVSGDLTDCISHVYYNSEKAEVWLTASHDEGGALYWRELKAPEQWKPDTSTKDAAFKRMDCVFSRMIASEDAYTMDDIMQRLENLGEVSLYLHELPAIRDIRKKVIRDKISKLFMEYIDSKD